MKHRAMSLIDVLCPPGNQWLKELSRRKADLPAGVKIVRFGDADEEPGREDEPPSSKPLRRQTLAA